MDALTSHASHITALAIPPAYLYTHWQSWTLKLYNYGIMNSFRCIVINEGDRAQVQPHDVINFSLHTIRSGIWTCASY